jgi:putative NADH-flavin reductase
MVVADKSMRLFVLGATGGIGRALVDQSLKRGHRVTAFVRSPEKLGAPREGLTVIGSDVLSRESIAAALANHDAVLSTIGPPGPGRNTITSRCAQATLEAMKSTGIRRLLIVGVAVLFDDAGFVASLLRRTLLRNVAEDSSRMERIVKASQLDWTIVRPPRLTNGSRTECYGVADDHLPFGSRGNATVSRADVAHFMLNEVEHPEHVRRIVGIAYTTRAKL